MVHPNVRKNEMFYLDIVYDDLKYYKDCLQWHREQVAFFESQIEKAEKACAEGSHVERSMFRPVRDQLPMADSCESFYISLLYFLARNINSIASFNALMDDILHYNKDNYLGWMRKQMTLMRKHESDGGLVCNI